MKKVIYLVPVIALFACNQETHTQTGHVQQYKDMFKRSMDIRDYQTAITAVHFILMEDSTQLAYKDSLPELYAAVNNPQACSLTVDESLKRHPDNEKLLQVKALVLQEEADAEGLLNIYDKLYKQTKKLSYLYQIGTIHFQTGKMDEAAKIVDDIITQAPQSKDSLDIFVNEQQKQKVPILAAAYNFRGYIFAQKRNLPEAKRNIEEAIRIFPDFVMARRNLQQMMSGRPQ